MQLNPSSQDEQTQENMPLAESEINRLISAARAESYRPSQTAPNTKVETFRPKSLLELARLRRDAEAAETLSDATDGDHESEAKGADKQACGHDEIATQKPNGETAPEADADTQSDERFSQDEINAAAPQMSQIQQDPGPSRHLKTPSLQHATKDAHDIVAGYGLDYDPFAAETSIDDAAVAAHDHFDEQALEQIHAKGFAAGRAAAEAEMKTRMTSAVEALEKAAHNLYSPPVSAIATLRADITEAVLKLAAERAGLEIETMPAAFVERIETLAERIHLQATQPVLRLNPDDHAAIAEVITGSETLGVMRIMIAAELSRGDVELIVNGLRMSDRLLDQPTHHKRANGTQKKAESDI